MMFWGQLSSVPQVTSLDLCSLELLLENRSNSITFISFSEHNGVATSLQISLCNKDTYFCHQKVGWSPFQRKETALAGRASLLGLCQHRGPCFMLLCFSVPCEELAENRQIPQLWLGALALIVTMFPAWISGKWLSFYNNSRPLCHCGVTEPSSVLISKNT